MQPRYERIKEKLLLRKKRQTIQAIVDVELLKGMSKINVKTCATSDTIRSWEEIDFSRAEKSVKKLQRRIATAVRNNDFETATILQHKLVHSFYAKALAIKRVTSAKGKRTAGVDGVIWQTSEEKFNAIGSLTRRGYKFSPLKRVYIPKKSGGKRAISIPTMRDRAWLTLHKFALEPIAEATADENSFGFRPARSASQAVRRCMEILSHEPCPEWILKTDVKLFFDSISQEWVMEHIPMDKTALRGLLSSGYICYSIYHDTDSGVPQGGSLSNVISNMVLDGLTDALTTDGMQYEDLNHWNDVLPIGAIIHDEDDLGANGAHCVELIRYADDMMLVSDNPTIFVGAVRMISRFLDERGLSLSQEKTKCQNIKDGVTFLGYEIHKDNGVVYAVPSRKGIDSLLNKVKQLMDCWPKDEGDFQRIKGYNNSLKSILGGWVACYKGTATVESLLAVRNEVVYEVSKLSRSTCYPVGNLVFEVFNHSIFKGGNINGKF